MTIRGGDTAARVGAIALAVALSACGGGAQREAATPRTVAIASFTAEVDPTSGTITVTPLGDQPLPAEALTFWTGLQQIPVVRNATWGNPAPGSVELRNSGTPGIVTDGCGPGDDSYEGMVQLHTTSRLRNVHVELWTISTTGHESCKSFPPPGLSSGISEGRGGIFPYGDLAENGSATALWSFRLPGHSTAPFTFQGRIMGEVVETTPPTTTAAVVPGTYAVTLTCNDGAGGSGCADTFYTVDNGPELAYTHPFPMSGTHTICYWSLDVAGNWGAGGVCSTLTVDGLASAAAFDSGVGAPVCPAYASTCDTSPDFATTTSSVVLNSAGYESHTPNTVDGCADSAGLTTGPIPDGVFEADEAVDRLVLETLGGGPLAPGETVRLTAFVTASYYADYFYAYYTTQLNGPTTTWIAVPGTAGTGDLLQPNDPITNPVHQVNSYEFQLPAGAVAIRGHVGNTAMGAAFACRPGANDYDDNDDLVFTQNVDPAGTGAPTVAITAPAGGATVSRTVLVTATATDDVAVTQVHFEYKATSADTWEDISTDTSPPWAVAWDSTGAFGSTDLRATATDNAGNTTSAVITLNVLDQTPPAVTLASPAPGGSYARSGAVALSATAIDARGVGSVDWYVDGVAVAHSETLLANDEFAATFDPLGATSFAAGSHTGWARATDLVGNVSQTPIVQFTLY